MMHMLPTVERSSSVVECRTRNRGSPGSNPPLLPFRRLGIFRSLHRRPCSLSCINEYLAIDSAGNVSDLVLARNCCLARMLPGEAENGVGMNRSTTLIKSTLPEAVNETAFTHNVTNRFSVKHHGQEIIPKRQDYEIIH